MPPQGYHEFTEAIRRAFALPCDSELNITFTCDEPSSGEEVVGGERGAATERREEEHGHKLLKTTSRVSALR